ncbi:unnamed protein product [Musa banksii]
MTDGLPIPTNLDTKDVLKFSDVIGKKKARTWYVGSVGIRHVESELKGFDHSKISEHCSTSNVKESSLEKIKKCNIPSVENPTAQMCPDIELTGESEMDMGCRKQPSKFVHDTSVKVIEEKERKKDSIQKQNQGCTECIAQKGFMHFSTCAEMRPLAEG